MEWANNREVQIRHRLRLEDAAWDAGRHLRAKKEELKQLLMEVEVAEHDLGSSERALAEWVEKYPDCMD